MKIKIYLIFAALIAGLAYLIYHKGFSDCKAEQLQQINEIQNDNLDTKQAQLESVSLAADAEFRAEFLHRLKAMRASKK